MESFCTFGFTLLLWCAEVHGQIKFNVTRRSGEVSKCVGETVTLQWNITQEIDSDKLTKADLLLLNPVRVLYGLSRGNDQPVQLEDAPAIFGKRISASIIKVSEGKNTYQLTLQNLKFNESGLFELEIGISRGNTQTTERATINLVVTGGPKLCQDGFPSNFTFEDNSSPRVSIILCGVPQPRVQGEFIGKDLTVLPATVNNYTHNFTLQLPRLTETECGKELTIKAIGHNGTLNATARIFVENFIPAQVKFVSFFTNEDQVGCNGTRRVKWQYPKTGSCPVEYTIQFKKAEDVVLGKVENITDRFHCTSDYNNATSVVVWATYKGRQGDVSEETLFTPTPKPITHTSATTSTGSTGEGDNELNQGSDPGNGNTTVIIIVVVVLLVVAVGLIVVIIMIKKKQKGGNDRSKKSQDDVVELKQPSYTDEGDYASVDAMQKKSAQENNPDQMLYAELGAGGGRKGPKPEPMESNYAQVKVDEMGYPARGPASDMSQQAPYPTSINRDRSRRHSPPPNYGEMDEDDGVVV